MGRKVLSFILTILVSFLISNNLPSYQFFPWMSKYPLKGRSFKDLSIDLNDFNSGGKYENLNNALVIRLTEGTFHFLGRLLDNECWAQSPGNFCNYELLMQFLDPGLNPDNDSAGSLRTVPYEPCNHKDTACLNCAWTGTSCNPHGDDTNSSGYSDCFWYVATPPSESSGSYVFIYPNGWWEHGGDGMDLFSGGHGSVCDTNPDDCATSTCEYCSSYQESSGNHDWHGYYCYPGDEQAIYIDRYHMYYDPNATYSKFRDDFGTLIPSHKGYSFPSHYYYPDPSPYTDGSTWDGTDITSFGFCAGDSACGDIPGNSIYLRLTIPQLYIEIGVHDGVAGSEHTGRGSASSLDVDLYLKFFFWDNSSDTSPSPGCDTDDDNNYCNDNINNPDGMDVDVQVTDTNLHDWDVDVSGNGLTDWIVEWIAELLEGTLEDTIRDSLNGTIKNALASGLPYDMNNILGDPWNTGTGLLDVGIYPGTPDSSGTRVAQVICEDGSTGMHQVTPYYDSDGKWNAPWTNCSVYMPAAIAVEPILFNSDCSRDPDLNNPEPTDFFGICTLHNYDGSEDEDQQFDMNDGYGADYFGPPLVYKANAPPDKVTPPSLDTIQPITFTGSDKNAWGNFNTVLYDANHNGVPDDGTCSDSSFTDNNNDGIDDNNPNCTRYSLSLDIHYNFLRQALYSMYASGMLDFAVSATEPIGGSAIISGTYLKNLLNVDTFSSFIPVLKSIAKDNSYVAIRTVPRGTPTALTGYFNYDNSSGSVGEGGSGTYDIGMYFPAVDFEFWFQDKNGVYKRIMTLRWNLLVGLDIEFYRGCHPDDPAYGTSRCTDPNDPAYIPGYLMIYAELNNPDLADSLGISTVEVVESEIDVDTDLLKDQFSNLIPMILSTFLQMKLEMRMPRIVLGDTIDQGATFNIFYMGPEGPSVSGQTKGDYFGVYIDILGSANIFDLLQGLTSGSPVSQDSIYPDTFITAPKLPGDGKHIYLSAMDFKNLGYTRSNVHFSWSGRSDVEDSDELFYTYRIDGGLWHPPTKKRSVNFRFLPDGKHQFEVATIHHIGPYQFIDPTPAKVEFVVDTTPPDINFIGGTKYEEGDDLIVNVHDFASGDDSVKISWSIDGNGFTPWVETRLIPLAGLKPGTHRIVVKAMDEAGNVAEKGLVFEIVKESGFGCSQGGSGGAFFIFILLIAAAYLVVKKELVRE